MGVIMAFSFVCHYSFLISFSPHLPYSILPAPFPFLS